MAELLVKAKAGWRESISLRDRANWTEKEVQQFRTRTRIGDIIAVKPDGHVWGNAERLPSFVVVRVSGLSLEEAQQYAERLVRRSLVGPFFIEHEELLRRRRFQFPPALILQARVQGNDVIDVDLASLRAQIIEHTDTEDG